MTNSSEFKIYRSKQKLISEYFIGGVLFLFGCLTLYSSLLTRDEFIVFFGLVFSLAGMICIYIVLMSSRNPLIFAYATGVEFDIAFNRKVFIPWEGIEMIDIQIYQGFVSGGGWGIKCLVFYIHHSYCDKIPLFLKDITVKVGNKIYFDRWQLSIPIDVAVDKLRSYIK